MSGSLRSVVASLVLGIGKHNLDLGCWIASWRYLSQRGSPLRRGDVGLGECHNSDRSCYSHCLKCCSDISPKIRGRWDFAGFAFSFTFQSSSKMASAKGEYFRSSRPLFIPEFLPCTAARALLVAGQRTDWLVPLGGLDGEGQAPSWVALASTSEVRWDGRALPCSIQECGRPSVCISRSPLNTPPCLPLLY